MNIPGSTHTRTHAPPDDAEQMVSAAGLSAPVTPVEFFTDIAVNHTHAIQAIVTASGPTAAPNDHTWNSKGGEPGVWMAGAARKRKPAYFTAGAFDAEKVKRFQGRTKHNVVALRGFWLDVEAQESKGGYPGGAAAGAAIRAFIEHTRAEPSFIVSTGSGGAHLHFALADSLGPSQWEPRAKALIRFVNGVGLKVDEAVTADSARILRAPGGLHQKTGVEAVAYKVRDQPWTLAEFDALIGFEAGKDAPQGPQMVHRPGRGVTGINADVLGDVPRYSFAQAADRCGAIRKAVGDGGRDTPYPVWLLALKTAELSVEGRDMAHQISHGHPDYDPAETDKKLASLTGGPAPCDTWAKAWGRDAPCGSCEWRGKLKNPAVQLGSAAQVVADDKAPAPSEVPAPPWVAEMNRRYAVVRVGTRMSLADFQSPVENGLGVRRGLGWLDLSAFTTQLAGRFAPQDQPNSKAKNLAAAWLQHTGRRQYEGVMFAPGQALPPSMLNLWQGYAVERVQGDVTPWLEVLRSLIPEPSEREYVLKWLALKVQQPATVPDTILVLKGAKGAGKNSLLDPVLAIFGCHGMLVDDPELIAGRFTWHLMDKAFAVLDEAVFVGDPKQADRIKSRVTAKSMTYDRKGQDPVPGTNRCAYVMLTNHDHVWQATTDERRAVVIEAGEGLRGKLDFWGAYHSWSERPGPGALLHHLLGVDLRGFNPRAIPRTDALRQQIEHTALRDPLNAWWHGVLTDGAITSPDGRRVTLSEDAETPVRRELLQASYEAAMRQQGKRALPWALAAKRVKVLTGGAMRAERQRVDGARFRNEHLPSLNALRTAFTAACGVAFDEH